MSDNVNHPKHYETGRFECIEVMEEALGTEAVKGFCLCNASNTFIVAKTRTA